MSKTVIDDELRDARLQIEQIKIAIGEAYKVVHHLQQIESVLDLKLLNVHQELCDIKH